MSINSIPKNKIDYLREYFEENVKIGIDNSCGKIGIEIELFCFKINNLEKYDDKSRKYIAIDDLKSIYSVLDKFLNHYYKGRFNKEVTDEVIYEINDVGKITFEPAGQLEISTIPFNTLNNLFDILEDFLLKLEKAFNQENMMLIWSGCDPYHHIEKLNIINKKNRYKVLSDYFNRIGSYGIKMMLQTASIHINIDLGKEDVFVKRWSALNLISPFIIAIFANSSKVGNEITDFVSYRNYIWINADKSRTGFPLDFIKFGGNENPINQYYEFSLDANTFNNISFRNWLLNSLSNLESNKKELKNHMTTLFPNVRLREYFEVRYVDCPKKEWFPVPIIVIIALIYNDDILNWILDKFNTCRMNLDNLCMQAVRYGLQDEEINKSAKIIFEKVFEGLDALPNYYLDEKYKKLVKEFYLKYSYKRKHQGDESDDIYYKDSKNKKKIVNKGGNIIER